MNNSTEQEQQPLAIVQLDLGNQIEQIKLYEGEEVELVVQLFCSRFDLDEKCEKYLIEQINQQLQKEPSPRFGDSFGQNFYNNQQELKQSKSQQSEIGQTTQATSVDDNQSSAQKSYEQWQQLLTKKTGLKTLLSGPQNTMQWSSPNTARSFIENKKNNVNERLYREGQNLQKSKQEKSEFIQKQKQQQEYQQATFKPLISPRSRQIAEQKKLSKPELNINIGQKLYQQGQDLNLKKQQLIKQNNDKQRLQSPFQPKGSDTSRNYSQNRSNTPIYEKLLQQAKEDKKKKEEFINQEFSKIYTFHPQTKNPRIKTDINDQQKLVTKLFKEHEEKQLKLQQKKIQILEQNQPAFQPQIKKDTTYQKVSKKKDKEDTELAFKLLQQQSTTRLKSQGSLSTASETRLQSQNSSKTMFDIQVEELFKQLDNDNDGKISSNDMNLELQDFSTLEQIQNVLYQIDEQNIIADINKFKSLCQENGVFGYKKHNNINF